MAINRLRFNPRIQFPQRVYLDTNVLAHARDSESKQNRRAGTCLAELAAQGTELCVSPLVIDELWWALFRVSYRQAWGADLKADAYKRDPGIWRDHWSAVRRVSDEILAWDRLIVLDEAPSVPIAMVAADVMDRNHLSPRDAFHLAIVLHDEVPAFVTADSDFDGLELPPGRIMALIGI